MSGSNKAAAPHQRDYFAELYVAGLMGDAGWSVYFPKRDVGFDFIATYTRDGFTLVRPVQVKGLYPTEAKKDRAGYGYIGKLTQLHDDMVLVLPYFSTDKAGSAPACIAYMPRVEIRSQASRHFQCRPARFVAGGAKPRPSFEKFFGSQGLHALTSPTWGKAPTP
jgi:hypothetical protein